MGKGVNRLIDAGIQVIWQTGKGNIAAVPDAIRKQKGVCVSEFINKMSYAYKASDIVVSRAGAIALAEICASGKPSVLVPFPLAAEDHQTVNAQMLVSQGAACMVRDNEAEAKLVDVIIELINDKAKCTAFGEAAIRIDKRDADQVIAELIVKKMQERNG
jgi:UDP-N-acetylglucosamine--N-acetylmuramyl-(pentapeptide) pyrophosphoryl-undecaprenol N-acetylglucosamine transferase